MSTGSSRNSSEKSKDSKKSGVLRSLSFQFTHFRNGSAGSNSDAMQTKKENEAKKGSSTSKDENGEEVTGIQCYGMLLKKYKKKKRRARWIKRFFVLKECFLLYYPAKDAKKFAKTKELSTKPKGFVSISGCSVVSGGDVGKRHCLLIAHACFTTPVIVCAPDFNNQERWLNALKEATKISYENTLRGEALIKDLEDKGLKLHQEKQEFVCKLQTEATALREEIDKNETLEKVKSELEMEKIKLVRMTKKLKADLDSVKNDLQITTEMKKTLEQEKLNLNAKTNHLTGTLETLEMEKCKINDQMNKVMQEREIVWRENQTLSSATCHMQKRLVEIEAKTSSLLNEKETVETQLRVNRQKTDELEQERAYYNQQTNELMISLQELNQQKQMTEAELKDEVIARIAAEKQLYAAEKALEHLEEALRLTGAHMTELKEQIMPDVRELKQFFEKCAEQALLDANKPLIMKNAVYARRSIRRSKNRFRTSLRQKLSMLSSKNGEKEVEQRANANQPTITLL